RAYCLKTQPATGETYPKSDLFNKAHEAQMERKESAFNQTEFNKLLLECVVKTQSSVAKILGIESLSPHVSGNPKFEYANMVEDIREKVSSEMERFFPKNDDE
ncbi:conjugal transfer relaxosome DNA-binding protein TraM, partial [Escherichia coli]|uniref:conjugal transfer relaxosome DNA-binding protein TraM n=1 Tax=Escherichia coli TaxID=562 RepID=UPI00208DD333